ncbi:MAG: phosphatidate cytidylyltransferase [Chitinophagaceae bacterium]|jgi:phosphatidate cytidylyltransferase|nr:phosphatidate cytidylyltransferase [Chitinophagaceae bacterium]OQY95142.1 MAG: phosphatidate cytidylyltransferase [Sphingobacteriales bacterium UTBCD1]
MALNVQTFKTRTLTAAVFVVVMLTGLFWNHWSFLILFSIIHFGCWREYLKLIEKIRNVSFHIYFKLGLMVLGFGLLLWFCGPEYMIGKRVLKNDISLPVAEAGFVLMCIGIFLKRNIRLASFGAALPGLLYISLSWGLMIDLQHKYFISENTSGDQAFPGWYRIVIPCAIIFSIWINDTMAYIVGSMIGKTPLSKISPKKTVEGTSGGIILAVAVAALIAWLSHFDVKIFMIIAAIASVAGTLGDLLESKLKRMAGVKDSGQIMPGHGGFLDRFDSLLLAVPAVWLYVYFFLDKI